MWPPEQRHRLDRGASHHFCCLHDVLCFCIAVAPGNASGTDCTCVIAHVLKPPDRGKRPLKSWPIRMARAAEANLRTCCSSLTPLPWVPRRRRQFGRRPGVRIQSLHTQGRAALVRAAPIRRKSVHHPHRQNRCRCGSFAAYRYQDRTESGWPHNQDATVPCRSGPNGHGTERIREQPSWPLQLIWRQLRGLRRHPV